MFLSTYLKILHTHVHVTCSYKRHNIVLCNCLHSTQEKETFSWNWYVYATKYYNSIMPVEVEALWPASVLVCLCLSSRTLFFKARNLFEPAKPFLVNLNLKIERWIHCMSETSGMKGTAVAVHIKNIWIKQLCTGNQKVWDFATTFQVRKRFGTFEKWGPAQRQYVMFLGKTLLPLRGINGYHWIQ